jgi:hypothetical protein
MSTKKIRPWRKLIFDMLPFGLSGTRLEFASKGAMFMSSTIGSSSITFVCDNEEVG